VLALSRKVDECKPLQPGHEMIKKEGYGNVPADELEAQIRETIVITKKLMVGRCTLTLLNPR